MVGNRGKKDEAAMKRHFPAIIDTDEGRTVFGVTFADFPGCTSGAGTAEEAMERAGEALAGHVACLLYDGEPIPDPTPVTKVTPDPDLDVVCLTLVAVNLPGRARRINISMDEGLIEEIDAAADNRSRFLAEAARAELARRRDA